jgi:hypothetical protein
LSRQLRVSSLGAEKATTCIVDTCGFGLLDLVLLGVACVFQLVPLALAFGIPRWRGLSLLTLAYDSVAKNGWHVDISMSAMHVTCPV